MLVELTGQDGSKVFVNLDAVAYIRAACDHSEIEFLAEKALAVQESPEQITRLARMHAPGPS